MEFKYKLLDIMKSAPHMNFTAKKLADRVGIKSDKECEIVKNTLKTLMKDGEIAKNKEGKFYVLRKKKDMTNDNKSTVEQGKSKGHNDGKRKFDDKKSPKHAHRDGGRIVMGKDGRPTLARRNSAKPVIDESLLRRGILQGNAKGFAFFRPEDESQIDLFIPNRNLNGANHGDTVMVMVDGNEEESDVGKVIRIEERGINTIVGKFVRENNCGFVIADDKRYFSDIYIPKNCFMKAQNGMKVVAEITDYPENRKNPEGRIVEVLGRPNDVGCDVLSIVRSHGIKDEFETATMNEAKLAPQTVSEKAINGRTDFRDIQVITIDGEDARDLDDAISIEKHKDGTFTLGVHIADVTEYVKKGSALDKEALERATSVYFVDRVIPMLPRELSNGICSLNENVDRLTLSCIMKVGSTGNVLETKVCEGVIRTAHRMTYTDVTAMLEGDKATIEKFADIKDMVATMDELALILIDKRVDEGAIDFDTPEAKIILDERGKVTHIKQYERGISNRIIEEFMILANRAVAEYINYLDLPFIYRIHEQPNPEKIENFVKFANAMGVSFRLPQNDLCSKVFADMLAKLENTPMYMIINRVLLRSMQKAKYSSLCSEHFGLSADFYCHFTSPIRRYPDLFVHRMLKMMLHGEFDDRVIDDINETVEDIAKHCSTKERGADEAERDSDDLKKAEYMATMLGEEFDGIISGVTSFGIFVELDNTCEGLIRNEMLPQDTYEYNEKMYTLSGVKRSFHLGQSVKIKVASVDLSTRRVNFALIEEN